MTQHTALLPMHGLVDNIMSIVHALDGGETVVEIGLLKPFPMAVDVAEALGGIHRDEIGSHAHVRSILLMQTVQPQVSVTFESMIELHPWRH